MTPDQQNNPTSAGLRQRPAKRRLLPPKNASNGETLIKKPRIHLRSASGSSQASSSSLSDREKSPYDLFLKEKRAEVESDNPHLDPDEILEAVEDLWNEISAEERKIYEGRYSAKASDSVRLYPPVPDAATVITDPFSFAEPAAVVSRDNRSVPMSSSSYAPSPPPRLTWGGVARSSSRTNDIITSGDRRSVRRADSYDEAGKVKSLGKSPSMRTSSAIFDQDLQHNSLEQDVPE